MIRHRAHMTAALWHRAISSLKRISRLQSKTFMTFRTSDELRAHRVNQFILLSCFKLSTAVSSSLHENSNVTPPCAGPCSAWPRPCCLPLLCHKAPLSLTSFTYSPGTGPYLHIPSLHLVHSLNTLSTEVGPGTLAGTGRAFHFGLLSLMTIEIP